MRRVALALLILIVAVLALYSFQRYFQSPGDAAPRSDGPRNVYVITASGLRADRLSSYLYQPVQTPAIDFLAFDGVRFTNAYTASTESFSAHLSLFTGMYPFQKEPDQIIDSFLYSGKSAAKIHLPTLPGLLSKRGYRTAAFLSDPELRLPAFFDQLFHETFSGNESLYPWESGYSSSEICRLAREWIQRNQSIPHLVFINFAEPTYPFQPPAPYNKQYTRIPYDGEVAGVDEQVGLFVDLLKELGFFHRSIIVFTSPYGETLGETSRYASPDNSLLRVPLIMTGWGLLPRRESYDAQTGLIDVMPSLLDLLGYSAGGRLAGLPLFQKGKRVQISREFLLGTIPHAKFLGARPSYFVRDDGFLTLIGPVELSHPHAFADRIPEAETKAAIRRAKDSLGRHGIRNIGAFPEQMDTDPALLLEKVIHLARSGEPAIALDLLNVFLAKMPASGAGEYWKGMLAFAAGDSDAALLSMRTAAQLAPTPRHLAGLARIAVETGLPEETIAAVKRYRGRVDYLSYDIRSTYATALLKLGKQEEALMEFDMALKQNPRYAEAYLYRGLIWKSTGRWKEAEHDLKKAVEVKSNYGAAYQEVALLLLERGRSAEAVPYLRQLLRLEPANYEAMLKLATIHQGAGKSAEAKKLLQDVILNAPNEDLKSRAKKQLATL